MIDAFKWNTDYIIKNKLDDDFLKQNKIEKSFPTEIFVCHPIYKDYYVSQIGRVISIKRQRVKLLTPAIGGQPDRQYLYYTFVSGSGEKRTIGAHRATAEIFVPNFWGKNKKLDTHHVDGNKLNNNYQNLILLPTKLHMIIHKIKKIALFEDGEIMDYQNPLNLVYDTGLKLEDILLANKGKKKPVKSDNKYTVFDIKGYLVGFQYYPKNWKIYKK